MTTTITTAIIAFLLGICIGCIFYVKFLDKPESITNIKKQNIRRGGFLKNIFNSKK